MKKYLYDPWRSAEVDKKWTRKRREREKKKREKIEFCEKKYFTSETLSLNQNVLSFFSILKVLEHIPLTGFDSGPEKIFEAMRLRMERGVDGASPPKMSLVPPPGGFNTL